MTFKEILKTAIKKENHNTNNDWGFGGSYGTTYQFKNKISVICRTLCYRHAGSHNVCEVFKDGIELFYANKLSLSGEQLKKLNKLLK